MRPVPICVCRLRNHAEFHTHRIVADAVFPTVGPGLKSAVAVFIGNLEGSDLVLYYLNGDGELCAVVGHAAENKVEISRRNAFPEIDVKTVRIEIQFVVVFRCRIDLYAVAGERRALGSPFIRLKPYGVAAPTVGGTILHQNEISGTVLH